MIETIRIGTLRWHHILNPTEQDFSFLLEHFHFHPLDIEDCRSLVNQRPKIDVYDDYYFMILHFPGFDKTRNFVRTREEKIFWGRDFVVTMGKVHSEVSELFRKTRQLIDNHEETGFATSDALLYLILEHLMKESYILVRYIGDQVDQAGRMLFERKTLSIIEKISVTRRNIIILNTIFKPQLPVFNKFETGEIQSFAESMEEYWGNILDYHQKIWDLIEDYSELIEGYSKTFDSLQTNRTNEIMKMLTIVSAIVLPLTFVTGIYGMNIILPLQEYKHAFEIILGFMALLAGVMLYYFRKRNWM
ncbi:MAG: magnesium transporter CorA family protein [Bacteroidales bacterium]|jgi:magnesium transporter|nr:magnesium transporter CorA family protein [Bacteroidales bacterium]NPV35602.1 magnesium transporter CorA family protein [Bacteroidales bacterium]